MVKRVTIHDMKKRTAIEVAVIAVVVLMFTLAARLTGGGPFAKLLPWT